ncbi:MAG: hypothetical protein O7G85_06845, partial [Planctomycetota bacterium]|nr:hypothetical protein [Planctomycetota bacterium]
MRSIDLDCSFRRPIRLTTVPTGLRLNAFNTGFSPNRFNTPRVRVNIAAFDLWPIRLDLKSG